VLIASHFKGLITEHAAASGLNKYCRQENVRRRAWT